MSYIFFLNSRFLGFLFALFLFYPNLGDAAAVLRWLRSDNSRSLSTEQAEVKEEPSVSVNQNRLPELLNQLQEGISDSSSSSNLDCPESEICHEAGREAEFDNPSLSKCMPLHQATITPHSGVLAGNYQCTRTNRQCASIESYRGRSIRSVEETKNYLTCHRASPDYLEYFEISSDIFEVPLPVMLCLTEVESAYRPNALSEAGALGIAQFMPVGARQVAKNINENRFGQRAKWHEYKNRVPLRPDVAIPEVFQERDRTNPYAAIGAMGLTLEWLTRMYMNEIRRSGIFDESDFTPIPKDFFLFVVGAYNIGGFGRTTGILRENLERAKKDPSSSFQDFLNRIGSGMRARSDETCKHMNAIDACLTSGGRSPMCGYRDMVTRNLQR